MAPTLTDGDIVLSVKSSSFERGDIIAFYYNNKILVKRVVGLPDDQIDINDDGSVRINGMPLDQPYLTEKALGKCSLCLLYPSRCV